MYSFKQYSEDSDYYRAVEKRKPRKKIVKIFRYPLICFLVWMFSEPVKKEKDTDIKELEALIMSVILVFISILALLSFYLASHINY